MVTTSLTYCEATDLESDVMLSPRSDDEAILQLSAARTNNVLQNDEAHAAPSAVRSRQLSR